METDKTDRVTPAAEELAVPTKNEPITQAEKQRLDYAYRLVLHSKYGINGKPSEPAGLIPNSSSDDDGAEKGHVEQVNLQNNVSAKYVHVPYSSC